ncbi:MAG TPA: GNAT family N-acetyltransferase [Streptosporangiaceae bacterium]|nr:GNAT family N-acetyltransferase [Streptosporangiaceae bacterium]
MEHQFRRPGHGTSGRSRLEPITAENINAACAISVHPYQEAFVAPVMRSLAEAYAHADTAWPRLIVTGDEAVGFIMGIFDHGNGNPAARCVLLRLNIAAAHQGCGYGSFAVRELCAEARRRGHDAMTVTWATGEHSPEPFYLALGFVPTGQLFKGEVVAMLPLRP